MPFIGGAAGFCAAPWLPAMRWGSSAANTGACPWPTGCTGSKAFTTLHTLAGFEPRQYGWKAQGCRLGMTCSQTLPVLRAAIRSTSLQTKCSSASHLGGYLANSKGSCSAVRPPLKCWAEPNS